MALTVVTYGGGEVLYNIFNSIAMLLNPDGGLIRPIMVIAISCGGLWAACKAFFSNQAESFLGSFFLPLVAITGMLMMPTATAHIEDILTGRSYKVDHVPWFIARSTELISSIGYNITSAVETVMHVPDDTSYNATGMIFGSDTAMDISKYKISNAVLEQNLKRFSKQCVFYDLALNKYSLDELKKTSNLWKFLEDRTSKVRMIPYSDPTNPQKKTAYLNCQEAVRAMTPIFEKEKNYYAKQDIIKDLPLTFQALTGLKKTTEELVSQQLMMNVLSGEFSPNKMATSRAYTQQKNTYLVLGSLASNGLITMRAVLEAIIYAAIIFILPLSVLPGGISFLSNWLWLTIWIQLWPPFYAIINYIMQSVAQGRASSIFLGLSDAEKGLSLFTSIGLSNLHEDIFALSGYLAASIPFISYVIIKGGLSSFIQLAGSMMTPAHSAATAAAGEQAAGNYSFASTSFGQTSFGNVTGFQRNLAPSLSAGYFSENQGDVGVTYSSGEQIIKQNNSDLRMGVSYDESIIDSLQTAKQDSATFTDSMQKQYLESVSSHGRTMSDLTSYLSKSQSATESLSTREAYDLQESARFVQSQADNLSKQYGISSRDGMSLLVGAKQFASCARSIPILGSLVEGLCSTLPDYNRSTAKEELANSVINIAKNEDFQTHFQRVNDFAKSDAHTRLNDEGMRIVEGITNSLDQVTSSQEQYQVAKTHSDQISETASWASQNALAIRQALNQDLVNWSSEKLGPAEAQRVLTTGCTEEKSLLINEFVNELYQQQHPHPTLGNFQNPDNAYEASAIPSLDRSSELEKMHARTYEDLNSYGLRRDDFEEKAGAMETSMFQASENVEDKLQNTRMNIQSRESAMQRDIDTKQSSNVGSHMCQGIIGDVNLFGQYSQNNLPLGWKQE